MRPELKLFSTNAQVHLLRHFKEVSAIYLRDLSRQSGQPEAYLAAQINLSGSKFHSSFANSPLELFYRLKDDTCSHWQIKECSSDKTDYVILFDNEVWPKGIGIDNVIHQSELYSEDFDKVILTHRQELLVKILNNDKSRLTWQVNLIIGNNNELITAFPGIWQPPLNEKMTNDYIFLT